MKKQHKRWLLIAVAAIAAVCSVLLWRGLPGANYVAPQCSTNQIDSLARFYSVAWMLITRSVVTMTCAAAGIAAVLAALSLAAIDWSKMFTKKEPERVAPPIEVVHTYDHLMPTAITSMKRRFFGKILIEAVLDPTIQAITIASAICVAYSYWFKLVSDRLCLASTGPKMAVMVVNITATVAIVAAIYYLWWRLLKGGLNEKLAAKANGWFYGGYYLAPGKEGSPRVDGFAKKLLLKHVIEEECTYAVAASMREKIAAAVLMALPPFITVEVSGNASITVEIYPSKTVYDEDRMPARVAIRANFNKKMYVSVYAYTRTQNYFAEKNIFLNKDADVNDAIAALAAICKDKLKEVIREHDHGLPQKAVDIYSGNFSPLTPKKKKHK